MKVRPLDLPFRWIVESERRDGIEHLVDISLHFGNGECSCEHFQFNLRKKLGTGEIHRCKHILKAREAFTDMMVDNFLPIAKQEKCD